MEAGAEEGGTTVEAERRGASTVERVDACLADSVVETAINGDRGGRLLVDDGDRRRGGTFNVGDGLERLMGKWQVAGRPQEADGGGAE